MRLASAREIITVFGRDNLAAAAEVAPHTVDRWWRDKTIPDRRLYLIGMAYPHRLAVDDEGFPWWIEESWYEVPEWIPMHWWSAYLNARARAGIGGDPDQLKVVVDELARIKDGGGDVGLSLRYAITRKIWIPTKVETA